MTKELLDKGGIPMSDLSECVVPGRKQILFTETEQLTSEVCALKKEVGRLETLEALRKEKKQLLKRKEDLKFSLGF